MGHIHNINDTDQYFSIDPLTRVITNLSENKTNIVQNDHNSERFTFTMPRYVEDHDMTLCNKVQVHYINIGDAGRRSNGVYEVTDLHCDSEDENVVIFTWLISGNATQLVGPLTFAVRFACMTGEVVDYAWHTGVHTGISVGTSINNSAAIVLQYADVLESWYYEFIAAGNNGVSKIEAATTEATGEITKAASDGVSSVNNATSNGTTAIDDAASRVVEAINNTTSTGVNTVNNAANTGANTVNNATSSGVNTVNNAANNAVSDIESEKELAIETIKVHADEIVNLVLDRFPIAEEASF